MERYQLQEQAYFRDYAIELRDKFRTSLLSELRQYPNFVVFKSIRKGERLTKIPFDPKTGRPADPTDPTQAADVMTALRALASGNYNGIGFMLNNTPFAAIDLDGCVHDNRRVDYWREQAIQYFNSYTECSPSGHGLHVLVQADFPSGGMKHDNIEFYSKNRYITLTLRK